MSTTGPSLQGFIASVRAYLLTDAHIRERTAEGRPAAEVMPGALRENRFYYLDDDARQAFFHAIEDLAMEEARGTLVALVSSFRDFDVHRERYEHLAATIDQVAVAGLGRPPKAIARVLLKEAPRKALAGYQLVCLETGASGAAGAGKSGGASKAPSASLLFVCRATEDGGHVGFFTFNPRLSLRLRRELTEVLAGRVPELREFDRLLAVDQAAKQIEADFNRQREAVEQAMAGLREAADDADAGAGRVTSELERGALRLTEWKDRLNAMLAGPAPKPGQPKSPSHAPAPAPEQASPRARAGGRSRPGRASR